MTGTCHDRFQYDSFQFPVLLYPCILLKLVLSAPQMLGNALSSRSMETACRTCGELLIAPTCFSKYKCLKIFAFHENESVELARSVGVTGNKNNQTSKESKGCFVSISSE